jgi:hypothetical protein
VCACTGEREHGDARASGRDRFDFFAADADTEDGLSRPRSLPSAPPPPPSSPSLPASSCMDATLVRRRPAPAAVAGANRASAVKSYGKFSFRRGPKSLRHMSSSTAHFDGTRVLTHLLHCAASLPRSLPR